MSEVVKHKLLGKTPEELKAIAVECGLPSNHLHLAQT